MTSALSSRQLCVLRFVATGSPYPKHYSVSGSVTAFHVSEELKQRGFINPLQHQIVGSFLRRKRIAINTLNSLARRGLVINCGPSGVPGDGHGYWQLTGKGETVLTQHEGATC